MIAAKSASRLMGVSAGRSIAQLTSLTSRFTAAYCSSEGPIAAKYRSTVLWQCSAERSRWPLRLLQLAQLLQRGLTVHFLTHAVLRSPSEMRQLKLLQRASPSPAAHCRGAEKIRCSGSVLCFR